MRLRYQIGDRKLSAGEVPGAMADAYDDGEDEPIPRDRCTGQLLLGQGLAGLMAAELLRRQGERMDEDDCHLHARVSVDDLGIPYLGVGAHERDDCR